MKFFIVNNNLINMTAEELNTLEALLKKAKQEDRLRVYSDGGYVMCSVEYIYTENNVLVMGVKTEW